LLTALVAPVWLTRAHLPPDPQLLLLIWFLLLWARLVALPLALLILLLLLLLSGALLSLLWCVLVINLV
jgi:hypothetical protein